MQKVKVGRDHSRAGGAPRPARPEGVNLFSWFTQEGGVGNVARQVAEALLNARISLRVLSIDGALPPFLEPYRGGQSLPLDRRINLFVMPLSARRRWIPTLAPHSRIAGQVNVLMGFWELERLAQPGLELLSDADVFLAASAFLADVVAPTRVPVVRCGIPLKLPPPVPGFRERLGLKPEQVAFVTSADPRSDLLRKNPAAALEAFARSGVAARGARLVVKLNLSSLPKLPADMQESMNRFLESIHRVPGALTFDADLSYEEALGLYAACDAYVSLHRAEGFGLPLLEAMLLGKPVIATHYSGNCSFMTEDNACLVPSTRVPVKALHPAYRKESLAGAHWAEPDMEAAVRWFRVLAGDAELRREIGAAAQKEADAYVAQAAKLSWLAELQVKKSS